MHPVTSPVAAAMVILAVVPSHSTPVASTRDSNVSVSELWVEPEPNRDLFNGPGGERLAPRPNDVYRVIKIKEGGFSDGYTVMDPSQRQWSVKLYPEARTEVVASRILWALGYHQPPAYTLEQWVAEGIRNENPQPVGRFREEKPVFHGLTEMGPWSYANGPFAGSEPLAGLLVLNVMLGNSDLKDENNMIYSLSEPWEGAQRWYVARDLGQTFGRAGGIGEVAGSLRDDIDEFDRTKFILGVKNGKVDFELGGKSKTLFADITPADVRWICERLTRLTDAQWSDAFRAGGYAEPTAQRYIRRLKQKISEGLGLKS